MKKTTLLLLLFTVNKLSAQTTAIPDPVFEQVLVEFEIDSDGVVNGQIETSDALSVTSLNITSPNSDYIYSLTGIEAFTNLESLTVNVTMIEELNVSSLINLKYLDCKENMLSQLDVSNNPLLEYLSISTGGDVMPLNYISTIDLSNNPNINTLIAYGIDTINLKNGNNNPDMTIWINNPAWGIDPEIILDHTCIEVDNEELAQNNQPHYSEWVINHTNQSYTLVESCTAKVGSFNSNVISLYPNPASDKLFITATENISELSIYNMLGQKVNQVEVNSNESFIDVSSLNSGTYFIIVNTAKGNSNHKVIIQ